jgi:cell division protein FtsQ
MAARRGTATKSKRKSAAKAKTLSSARANKLAAFGFTGFLVLMAGAAAIALDLPAKAAFSAGEAVGSAGFRVDGYQIVGLKQMDRKLVDAVRRLPDTLVIDIVERTPSALWQDRQRLALIDSDGVVLDRVKIDNMPDLPLVIGPGANARASQLKAILADAPTMQAQLASATWVGGRRWDLSFQSGETVALPEGEQAARAALRKFAKVDQSNGLLGRGLVRFDLRIPGKMIVRLPRAPGEPIQPEAPTQTVEG